MFINFSNHPFERWNDKQKEAAACYGEIRNMAFPEVSPMATTQEIADMAARCAGKIIEMNPECVMCQGEFSLTVATIHRLQNSGIRCVCACSERKVIEEQATDGTTQRTSVFEFCQFREYERPDVIEGKKTTAK